MDENAIGEDASKVCRKQVWSRGMAAYSDGGVKTHPDDGVWAPRYGGETEQTSLTSGTARIAEKELSSAA